jgi:hypothetical protein
VSSNGIRLLCVTVVTFGAAVKLIVLSAKVEYFMG